MNQSWTYRAVAPSFAPRQGAAKARRVGPSYTTPNAEHRTLNAEREGSKVGRDRRARRNFRNGFYTKIAKDAKPVKAHRSKLVLNRRSRRVVEISVIKGKNRACLEIWCELTPVVLFAFRPFLSFVALAKEDVKLVLESIGAPGGRALPQKSESEL